MEEDSMVAYGRILNAVDYNSNEIVGDLPTIKRTQILEIALDESSWEIVYMKGRHVKLIIDNG